MKTCRFVVSILILLTLSSIHATPIHNRAIPPNHIHSQVSPHFQTSIAPLEININGTRTINESGEYYITSDIDYHPVNNGTDEIIIHITASNVSLNLNGKHFMFRGGFIVCVCVF